MTFITAEAGINHNGQIHLARSLIESAKEAGADAVKFQMFDSRKLKRPELEQYELSQIAWEHLYQYCEDLKIEFMCTAFDTEALKFLTRLGLKRIKISSGSIANFDLLCAAHDTGLPVILSTGMSTMLTISKALQMLSFNVTLLHCTSSYPCPLEDVNLNAMDSLRSQFRLSVGYSDHTVGILVAMAAVAKGATVIEKHLTLDKNSVGPDHKASIEPAEFSAMVQGIHQVEIVLGDGVKRIMSSEEETRRLWFPTAS